MALVSLSAFFGLLISYALNVIFSMTYLDYARQ